MDLSNQESWVQIYTDTQFLSGTPSRTNKIPRFYFSIPFISPYFKVYIQVFDAPVTWQYGGRLSLYAGDIANIQPVFISTNKLYLNMWKIVCFQEITLTTTSHLELVVPYWFPNVNFEVLQYQEVL